MLTRYKCNHNKTEHVCFLLNFFWLVTTNQIHIMQAPCIDREVLFERKKLNYFPNFVGNKLFSNILLIKYASFMFLNVLMIILKDSLLKMPKINHYYPKIFYSGWGGGGCRHPYICVIC